jgi:hypothetical protein
MSNQIVISSGAKVRSLEGVLTGTAGIVNSVPLGGANGVATLDALGKVPLSQLPASVVTYLGTWNAATNTPTLTNGVGDTGDLYICNVAGTVNFGAGPITFAAGDWVIYSGTEWQKSAGASGTVTSVALTESGDALTITGSPITTSGTINIGFAGTGLQYIKGDGTLATFPTTIDQAKRLITEVYNSTGATLTKGTVVYINGGQGNLPTVTKAQANNDANSAQTYGVVQDDITNNNNGFVVVLGSLTDLDTSAYVVGTQLYLSGTTAGAWTSTKPSAPIHLVYVAIVVRSHPTQGVVEVRIQNGYELEEIHDVAISAPVNNQGIFYNSSNDLWENKSIATALGYTPANDALVVHLAGTETITGTKTFTSQYVKLDGYTASIGNTINFKQYSTILSAGVGYSSIGAVDTTKMAFTFGNTTLFDGRNIYFDAVNVATGGSRTYSFPDLNGTFALLEGTQTFTGSKTFSATTLLNTIYVDGVSYLKHQTSTSYISGYTTFSAKANGVIEYYFPTSFKSILDFNDAADYTYTFPASSGTLALTSNLSSYVPYSGATSNVNLGTYNITTTGNVNAANFVGSQSAVLGAGTLGGTLALFPYATYTTNDGYLNIVASSTTKLNLIFGQGSSVYKTAIFDVAGLTNSVNRTYTLPDASGTLVLGTGTTNYLPKFTGASTLGNSLIFDDGTNVGIGTTSAAVKLDVNGGIRLADAYELQFGGSTASIYGSSSSNQLRLYTNNTERIRVTSTGVVAIGTSTNLGGGNLEVQTNGVSAYTARSSSSTGANGGTTVVALRSVDSSASYWANAQYNGWQQIFCSGGDTERMRITSGGAVFVNTASSLNGAKFEVLQSTNATNTITAHNNQASPYGIMVRYTASSPNNNDNWFMTCEDSSVTRIKLQSNGGIGNYSGNNTNYSDIRLKKDITPLESYWNKFKAIEIVKFKYIDQTHNDNYIGVIAQQIEEVAPEFVDLGEVDKDTPEDGIPIKSIYTEDLHHATIKVLQEAMAKIEELEAKVSALENKA